MSDMENPLPNTSGEKKADNTSTLDAHQKETLRTAIINTARPLLGIPYVWGAEWTDYSLPPDGLDCSELVEGCYKINGLKMPDGSQNQFDFTIPTGTPLPGDLAFFGKGGKPSQIYHVGLIFDVANIIEARGHQLGSSFETGKVILRPISAWQSYVNFCGFRSHPKLI